jgi:hypothetical protein
LMGTHDLAKYTPEKHLPVDVQIKLYLLCCYQIYSEKPSET